MAVSYGEVHGYPKSRWVRGEFFGTRKLRCAWADRDDLLAELDGTSWPYADGVDEAISREAAIEPLPAQLTADGNMASYEYALVTVKYSTVGPQLHSLRWIDESLTPFAFAQRMDHELLAWADGTKLAYNEAPSRTTYGLNYMFKLYNQETVPANVYDNVGYVNANAVTAYTLNMTFPIGTLLYSSAHLSRRTSWAGSFLWDAAYYFKYHPWGWNTFPRAATNAYEAVQIAKTGATFLAYPTINFSL